MRRERRELSLELGDARGQRVALGLERLAVARAHHHNLRLAPRFLNVGLGHCFLLLSSDDLVEVVDARAREERVLEDLRSRRADGGVRTGSDDPGRVRATPRPQSGN